MKITKFCLIVLYIVFLINGLAVLCAPEDGSISKRKKKKSKKKQPKKKDVGVSTDDSLIKGDFGGDLDIDKLQDAQEVLQKVLQDEELRAAEKKRKKTLKVTAIVLSTLTLGLLLALGGAGSYLGYKRHKGSYQVASGDFPPPPPELLEENTSKGASQYSPEQYPEFQR